MNRATIRLTFDGLDELLTRVRSENPKAHDINAITDSLTRFGFVAPVGVNDSDGKVLFGHGRLETLRRLWILGGALPSGLQLGPDGQWLVPALHGFDLSPENALAYLIADNRTTELGGWDQSKLAELLLDLSATGAGLGGVGFNVADLDLLLEELNQSPTRTADPDDIPETPDDSQLYVKRGDLYILDGHRILCADATDASGHKRLLRGQKADLLFTDPPYNVDYGKHGGAGRGRRRTPIANDALPAAEWQHFLTCWISKLTSLVDGELYICMSSKEWPVVANLLAENDCHWSDSIIWAKNSFTLGRSDYQRQFEPIWYGWPKGATRHWCGDRDQGDVWNIPRPKSSELHPTMKPVALVERALRNSSRRGGGVLDLFAGSGTTIIAAERLGLHAFAIEVEPRFVQVSIERWQSFTGRKARKES